MKLEIQNIAFGGYGVARFNNRVIFIESGITGDIIDADITAEHKSYAFARIRNIIQPAPERITPTCNNHGICGGCSYMNIDYKTELNFKKFILKDQIMRIAEIPESCIPGIDLIVHDRLKYRSHSNIKCDSSGYGFYKRGSNELIYFDRGRCQLLSDVLNEGIKNLNRINKLSEFRIAQNYKNICLISDRYGDQVIEERISGYSYARSIHGFFQSNIYLRSTMIDIVSQYSELTPDDEFMDICCGCGFFTIPLAKISKCGYGYDLDKKSISYAQTNSSLNDIDNIQFYNISESSLPPLNLNPKTIIIDPVRNGISKKGRKTINYINPDIIVYVSCNPSTFSRDIKDFTKNGYSIEKITLIDMFPCTYHIETIAKLKKSEMII